MTGATGASHRSAGAASARTTRPVVLLENELVALGVDERSGCIKGLRNKLTKRDCLTGRHAAEAFRVVMPLRHRVSGWFCDPLGHACDSSVQHAASVTLRRNGAEQVLVVSYDELVSDAGDHAVKVEYQATLSDGSDEIRMRLALTNDSSDVITELHFTWLVTLHHADDDRLVYPNVIRPLHDVFPIPHEGNWEEHPVLLHGTTGRAPYWPGVDGMSMPWVHVGNERDGLYVASLDRTGTQHSLVIRDHGDGQSIELGVAFGFLAQTGQGGRWESPTVIVSPHSGDWHSAADKYRESISGWYEPPEVSDHTRQSLGGFTTTLTSRDLGKIEELAEDISHYGLKDLQVFTFSNYFPMPTAEDELDHDPPRLGLLTEQFGGRKRFQRAVENALAHFGVRTGIILSQRVWNVATLTPDLSRRADAWVIKRASGAPVIETWRHNHFDADPWGGFRGEQLYVMCPAVDEWQDLTIANCRQVIERTGCKIHRYTLPWLRFGLPLADDIPTANRWFTLGLYLAVIPRGLESGKRLSDFPRFAEHLSKLASLRKRLEHILANGTFVDDVGVDITNGYGKAYATDDELAVVVASLRPEREPAIVRVDRDRWACTQRGMIAGLDGLEAPVALDHETATVELESYDVKVLLLPRTR